MHTLGLLQIVTIWRLGQTILWGCTPVGVATTCTPNAGRGELLFLFFISSFKSSNYLPLSFTPVILNPPLPPPPPLPLLQVYREQATGARSSLLLPAPRAVCPVDVWRVPLPSLPELQQLGRPPPAARLPRPLLLRAAAGERGVLPVERGGGPCRGADRVGEYSGR